MLGLRTYRYLALRALQVSDLIVFCGALAFVLWLEASAAGAHPLIPSWALFGWLAVSLVAWHLSLAGAKVYLYRSHRLSGGLPALEILSGTSMGAIGVGALTLLLQPESIRLNVVVHVWWISTLAIFLARMLLWGFLVSLRNRGRNLRFALIVGNGPRAMEFIRRIREAGAGYRVIGYVDDPAQSDSGKLPGIEYLGALDALPRILSGRVVDEVFVVLPMWSSYQSMAKAINHCAEQGIPVRMPSDLFGATMFVQSVDVIGGMPILSLVSSPTSH